MKLIHLNVESFKYFDALVDFLEVEKPDILSLVEASDGDFFGSWGGSQRDYIWELCQKFGWNSVFHPTVFRDFWRYTIWLWAAVLSQFPISTDAMKTLWEGSSLWPSDHVVFSDKPKYERYPHAWKWLFPLLVTRIKIWESSLKLITTHFHVSYECLETLQIWQDAEKVAKCVSDNDESIILTGDLNIRNESMAIRTLSENMLQQSGGFTNTLCRSIHPIFSHHPAHEWLGIDHVFTRDITVNSCEVRDEALVSDHLPLVLDFSL